MDFTESVKQGIEGIAKHLSILIATGDPAQDLLRPDEEALEDKQRMADDETLGRDRTRLFETRSFPSFQTSIPTPPVSRQESHVFQYFLDGSVHGRSLGTALEGTRAFHVGCYQVGAAIVGRNDEGILFPVLRRQKALVAFPGGAEGISPTLWDQMASLSLGNPLFQLAQVSPPTQRQSGRRVESDDMRLNSNSVATTQMHHMEVDLCEMIQARLDTDCRAIIDGSVKFGRFVNNPYVVGVAKSFWTNPELYVERGRKKERLNVVRMLVALPVAHRTPVFEASGGQVGFWYVRLRAAKDNPIEGVVKVELPRSATHTLVDSTEADWLSSAIVAERTTTTFSLDKRWPNLLYPIHYAEVIIKRGFIVEPLMDRLVKAAFRMRTSSGKGE